MQILLLITVVEAKPKNTRRLENKTEQQAKLQRLTGDAANKAGHH